MSLDENDQETVVVTDDEQTLQSDEDLIDRVRNTTVGK